MQLSACSYGRRRHSCAVKKSVLVKADEPVSTPQAFIKRRLSSTFVAKLSVPVIGSNVSRILRKMLCDKSDGATSCRRNSPTSFFSLFYKIQIPSMKTADISVSTGGEGTKDDQSLSRLMVSLHHVERVVTTSFRGEVLAIDDITD